MATYYNNVHTVFRSAIAFIKFIIAILLIVNNWSSKLHVFIPITIHCATGKERLICKNATGPETLLYQLLFPYFFVKQSYEKKACYNIFSVSPVLVCKTVGDRFVSMAY